jgi:hypothetical protein
MNIFSVWLLFATVMLNSCLACDLILMIKYPFKIKDKRMPWYIAISFFVATFLALAILFTLNNENDLGRLAPDKWVF